MLLLPLHAAQVFPQEVKQGLERLSVDNVTHTLVGCYSSLQAVMGRRHPSVSSITWKDVKIVKVAAMVPTASGLSLCLAFAVVMRFVSDKVTDKHGLWVVFVDPSGDSNIVEEQLQVRLRVVVAAICVGVACDAVCCCSWQDVIAQTGYMLALCIPGSAVLCPAFLQLWCSSTALA